MQREAAKLKVEQIEIAEKRRNEPVTDSQVVGLHNQSVNVVLTLRNQSFM